MPKSAQTCVASNVGGQKNLTFNTLEIEPHLERVDCLSGNEYVPMDVFVNPETRKEHFQYSPIRARWLAMPEAAAR